MQINFETVFNNTAEPEAAVATTHKDALAAELVGLIRKAKGNGIDGYQLVEAALLHLGIEANADETEWRESLPPDIDPDAIVTNEIAQARLDADGATEEDIAKTEGLFADNADGDGFEQAENFIPGITLTGADREVGSPCNAAVDDFCQPIGDDGQAG
jgi:hypothetical protein